MQDIILDRKVKFVNFSIYWIGYILRDLNLDLAPLSVQHSDIVSLFHKKCFKALNMFKDNVVTVYSDNIVQNLYLIYY